MDPRQENPQWLAALGLPSLEAAKQLANERQRLYMLWFANTEGERLEKLKMETKGEIDATAPDRNRRLLADIHPTYVESEASDWGEIGGDAASGDENEGTWDHNLDDFVEKDEEMKDLDGDIKMEDVSSSEDEEADSPDMEGDEAEEQRPDSAVGFLDEEMEINIELINLYPHGE